jgi:hypothetical protein
VSNYVKSTDFASKDNLSSGDPLKIVKGTEIDTEFNNIATAVATKADTASPTFTGSPVLPTGTTGVTQTSTDSSTALATTAFVQAVKASLFPVGAIYTAVVSTNPGTLLGFGTWTAFGAGRVMVGYDSGNALFDTAEETGGSADAIAVSHTHTATVTDPGHTHKSWNYIVDNGYNPGNSWYGVDGSDTRTQQYDDAWGGSVSTPAAITSSRTTGISVSNSTTGSSGTNANYQPYITVFMWKRVS